MWPLDRLASHNSQPPLGNGPSGRPFSPSPRESFQLGGSTLPRRPGLPSRTTSLSVASPGGSTDSLPASARVLPGTNLRKELTSSPAGSYDPVAALHAILGPPQTPNNHDTGAVSPGASGAEDVAAKDIAFDGMSLEEFATSALPDNTVTSTPNNNAVEQDQTKFEDLHNSILACDQILKSVETYLTSFQADLAAVSAEIETLQNRSSSLNTKLRNRKVVEKVLSPEVEALVVSPATVRKIVEGNVDDAWVKALEELDRRSKSIDAKLKEGKDIKAAQDIQPLLDDVANKAVERIRDYVVAQIKALRSPNINAQVIQQTSFIRYRGVFAFLAQRQPQLADEISQAYTNTMRWYYTHNFGRYRLAIEQVRVHAIDQTETIASDPAKRVLKAGTPSHDAFSIGRRMDILKTSNSAALPSYLAEDDKTTHYLEVPFRTFNLALVDNASAEYSFLSEFFTRQSYNTTSRKFNELFQPVFELGQALTKHLIEQTADALGILICVRLNQHFAFELQRRKVPAVEGYINGTNMLLWPRFQQVIDLHCESIRKLTASLPGKPAGSALTLTASSAATQTTAPHALTQRFANFMHGILSLSSEAGDDEPIASSVGRLRKEFIAFLEKQSKGIAEARKRERFMFNNYSLICTITMDTEGKMAEEFNTYFVDVKDGLGIDS